MASEFKINIFKVIKILFLYNELLPYKDKVIEQLQHLYSKKVGKVVFPTVIIRLNNTQAISKLTEFLINLGPNYLKAINHNIYYLVSNKYLTIKYKAENKNSKLITIIIRYLLLLLTRHTEIIQIKDLGKDTSLSFLKVQLTSL